jgi:hypothetical protein
MSSQFRSAHDQVRHLAGRARHLRRQALIQPAPLASAYRRRAAELELEAHILEERLVRFVPEPREPSIAA